LAGQHKTHLGVGHAGSEWVGHRADDGATDSLRVQPETRGKREDKKEQCSDSGEAGAAIECGGATNFHGESLFDTWKKGAAISLSKDEVKPGDASINLRITLMIVENPVHRANELYSYAPVLGKKKVG
jgi:hypothetical protein